MRRNQYPGVLAGASRIIMAITLSGLCGSVFIGSVAAQDKPLDKPLTPAQVKENEARAEGIVKHALASVGGNSYLQIHSVFGRGLFTPFRDGKPEIPSQFLDYLIFPDHERTEFRGGGNHVIQANLGDKGWVFDGATRMIKDMSPAQVSDFHQALRTSIDSLLREWWRKDAARLSYAGRRDAGVGKHNDAVRLMYPDGFSVEFEFGSRDGLPAKISYTKKNADGEEALEEDRLLKPIIINGITAPFVVDHYRAGVQISRLSFESVEYNAHIPDSLFTRPTNVKSLK